MISRRMTRGEMIRWLGNAISTETEKPFEEIDYGFVDECGQLLDELMGESAAVPDDEILGKIEKWKAVAEPAVKKKKSYRNIWKIAVAAAVVVCMSLAVLAVPTWREAISTVLRLDSGESVRDNGLTYIHDGEVKCYSDMKEFIANEDLELMLYTAPDDSLTITTIKHLSDISRTFITFSDPTIYFCVEHHVNTDSNVIMNKAEKYSTLYFDAYIEEIDEIGGIRYNACFFYNSDMYSINCSSRSELISILNSLCSGEIR